MRSSLNPNAPYRETARSRRARSLLNLKVIGAVAAIGIAISIFGDARLHDSHRAVQPEELAAQRTASMLTADLYDTAHFPHGVKATVLNGLIRLSGPVPHVPGDWAAIGNPILLETAANAPAPAVDGKFLQGAFLAIQTHRHSRRVMLIAIPFNAATEQFIPDDRKAILLPPSTQFSVIESSDPIAPDGLIAFDSTGATKLRNGDGTTVLPGQLFGSA